jgi:serine protease
VREITSIGVLVVAAAGNDGSGVYQPANCPGALAVAGLRHAGTKVGFSNLGPEVAVAAPAGNCGVSAPDAPCLYALTTLTNLGDQDPDVDDYSLPQAHPSFGTSFSSPLVAATAGLMKTVNPALTPALLISRIRETARAFPTTDELGTSATCTVPSVAPAQDVPCVCTTVVCGATGGAGIPLVGNADRAVASVTVPTQGSVTLQLLVTDSSGDSDTAVVTITSGGADSSSRPPVASVSRGGGSMDFALLTMLCLLLLGRCASLRPARPFTRA